METVGSTAERTARPIEHEITRAHDMIQNLGSSISRIESVLERLQSGPVPRVLGECNEKNSVLEQEAPAPELHQLACNMDTLQQKLDQLSDIIHGLESI